ncbi:MAG: adenosine deaminase [Ilumatobacteraceae bacterium]
MTTTTGIASAGFIRALPKAELHVHLEGCLEAELLFRLAERNDVALPWRSIDELRTAYRYDDLQSFLDLFFEGCKALEREQDFYDLTREYLTRAHADGVVHAEMFLGAQNFTSRDIPMAEILGGTFRAIDDAADELGISAELLLSVQRHRTEAEAFTQLDAAAPWLDRIAGYGLGGAEVGNPPTKFARYFDELHRRGYKVSAHAGEEGPADYVRQAVDDLGVDRVDHGVHVLDDPELVARLAGERVPFTVCPLSNVRLQVVPDLVSHPLPAMVAAGLTVMINSDDPAYFASYVGDNYEQCTHTFGLGPAAVAGLAAASIHASYLPDDRKRPFLDRIAGLLAAEAAT